MQHKNWGLYRRYVILLLLLSLLTACGTPDNGTVPSETSGQKELWIVMDANYAIELGGPIGEFYSEHPGVTVTLETFPQNAEEREVYLQQLRVQIMAGKGPDIYLMSQYSDLFQNVTQSMHNGLFLDISDYYDADTELNKDAFAPAVMEAGVLDGTRYVLPLRYDLPILYVDVEKLEGAGLKPECLGNGLAGLEEVARALGSNAVTADCGIYMSLLCYFPEVFDYKTDNVILAEEEMEQFLGSYQSLLACLGGTPYSYYITSCASYVYRDEYWANRYHANMWDGPGAFREILGEDECCVNWSSLSTLHHELRIARATDTELAVLPVRATDGSLVASITAYGAVSTSCDDPGLAYEFLRNMLLEESQWAKDKAIGWPVLTEGYEAVVDEDLMGSIAVSFANLDEEDLVEGYEKRQEAMEAVILTKNDYPVLNEEIDRAIFPLSNLEEIENQITHILDPSYNPDAPNVDIHEFAQELLRDLRIRLAEG